MREPGRAANHHGVFIGAYVSKELAEWYRAKANGRRQVSSLVREALMDFTWKNSVPEPDSTQTDKEILAAMDARSLMKKLEAGKLAIDKSAE